jgi:hypothetical protein
MDVHKTCHDCESSTEYTVTVCKTFTGIEIAPNYVKVDDLFIRKEKILELWIDYGDGMGLNPEIVHSIK